MSRYNKENDNINTKGEDMITKRSSEEEMKLIHKYCEEHGGKCLEGKYNRIYKCMCRNGHSFELNQNDDKNIKN